VKCSCGVSRIILLFGGFNIELGTLNHSTAQDGYSETEQHHAYPTSIFAPAGTHRSAPRFGVRVQSVLWLELEQLRIAIIVPPDARTAAGYICATAAGRLPAWSDSVMRTMAV
jgi:hypothetical protein